jgi:simple sugar transport system ATP-binding protein
MAPFIELKNITKRFPGVIANDQVDLTLNAGEIHALLGENGAGKSTLMNILYGLYHRDEGEILIQGQPVDIRTPSDAIALGIGMIHQDFMLIPPFTVTENVVVGLDEAGSGPLLDLDGAALRIEALSKQHGLAVDPHARVEHLSVGVEQRVEILKLLYRNAKLLILDEPTAVLTPQEADGLFEVLRSLASKDHTIIFITHKLHEIMAVSDRVTVMRDGKVIATLETETTNPSELAMMMVGREVVFHIDKQPQQRGERVLQVEDLQVDDESGYRKVRGVSLDVYAGEIVGLAGVDGNGQSELAQALMNLRPITEGRVSANGVDVTHTSSAAHRSAGMAYIPADRRKVGSVSDLSIANNAILGNLEHYTTVGNLLINNSQVKAHAEALVERFDVRPPNIALDAGKLSGGNLQKVVLGREVMHKPSMLIAEQPTRGLDVGATEFVRRQLLAERDQGSAILLISAELEEILALSDRIAIIHQGEIMGVIDSVEAEVEAIGLMMGGTRAEDLPLEGDDG